MEEQKEYICRRCKTKMAEYTILPSFQKLIYCDNPKCIIYGFMTNASVTKIKTEGEQNE